MTIEEIKAELEKNIAEYEKLSGDYYCGKLIACTSCWLLLKKWNGK